MIIFFILWFTLTVRLVLLFRAAQKEIDQLKNELILKNKNENR